MPDLVMVVPSRARPDAVAELATACRDTCTADTWLLAVVDDDDPKLKEYHAPAGTTVYFTRSPADSGHVAAINSGAARALADFAPAAIGKLDDDHRPRTAGWDSLMLGALRELGTGIVYGNDLLQGANLPTAPVLSADIVDALGFMGPPVLRHLFVDNFWRDLGQAAGCLHYMPDVVVEHMHPVAGKARWTEGHQAVNAPELYARDGAAYQEYRRTSFDTDVAKIRALRVGTNQRG